MPSQGNQLQLSFGVNAPESRAIHKDATLPDNSPVGVKLDGYADYANLVYKGTTTGSTQSWALTEGSVTLTDTKGTIYAYWPYSSTTSIDAIDVDMTAADQTDWLYATPVTGICEDKAEAAVTMNHAAANVNVTINKGTYLGSGAISNITVQSDGIALGGTFNAAQATPDYTAFEDEGKPLSRDLSATTGAATDIMVVPTGASAAITFTATIDGIQFTATSAAVKLEKGNSYVYTLNLSDISTYMSIGSFAVKTWTGVTKDNLNLVQKKPVEGTIDLKTAANGVYAVAQNGKGVAVADADESCVGVALITANQRILIEKNGESNTEIIQAAYTADAATSTGYTNFYWGSYGTDVNDIINCSDATAAKADFNGKANTAAIIATPDTDSKTVYANMSTYCTKFNEMNGNYSDWYIPAAGQFYEIYTNITDINAALEKIGGTKLSTSDDYWSSSEYSSNIAWYVNFNIGGVSSLNKNSSSRVRFVRDIVVEEKPSAPAINSAGKANGVYVVTAAGELVDKSTEDPAALGVALITDNQRVLIPKADATDGTNTTLYWGKNLYKQNAPNLAELADATAAKADFKGKANTAAIIAAYAALGKDMDNRDMCKVLSTYTEGGFTDWYVPAAGQLYEIYTKRTAINEALTAISGTAFNSSGYWSSSEESVDGAWGVTSTPMTMCGSHYKNDNYSVRFIRDIP